MNREKSYQYHFNAENIFARGERWIYVNQKGLEFDVTDLPVWWICSECGHDFRRSIKEFLKGDSCPNCEYIHPAENSN